MVAAGPYRIDREIFALPGLVGCAMLFAAATAREALATGTVESTHVPLNQKGAVPTVLPLENVHPHPYTPLNLVVGQSSGGFGSSVIRGRQKKWERSHFLAFTGGLVAVVYLAVAFVILRCARKALHPRLFGSLSARSLSSSELEEHRVHACIDEKEGERGEEDEREDEAGDAGAGPHEYLIKEGESKALQALEELQHIVTLGVQALPYLSLEKKFPLILFLMRVCTQELILLGIYSTPKVDLKRQETINFILHQGEQALAQIVPEDPRNNAAYRTNEILRLLGRFRSAPRKSNGEELGVEASISAYRISECKRALEKLQPWVETSIPIPNDVAERVIKTLTFTRGTGKRRMIVDDAARSWVAEVQARFGCFALMEKNCGAESNLHKRQFDVEMEELQSRYGRLERSLDCSIQSALSGQPPKQELHVQEQHEECMHHQEQALQPLYQQQYHSAYQLPENIGALSSAFQSVEQLAVLRTGVGMLPSHPSWPLIIPSQRAVPTPTPHLPNFPGLHSAQPPSEDLRQHMPTAHLAPRHQLPPHTASSWQKRQQETRDQQQSSFDSSTPKSVLRVDAPVFIPRQPSHPDAQRYESFSSSDVQRVSRPVPPPPGFPSHSPLSDPLSPVQSDFALPRPPPAPTQFESECFKAVLRGTTPAPDGLMADHQHPRLPQPMPGPSFTGPLPTQPTNAPSLRFPRPASQRPTSETPSRMVTPSVQFPGGWRPSHASRFVAPAAFWPPPEGAAQGGIDLPPGVQIGDLDPVGRLIAEAFPESETHSPEHAAQRRQGDGVWPQGPTLPPFPPSGSSSAAISAVEGKTSMPAGNEGASSSFELTLRTQGGAAWSLWGDRGTGSAH